ncbi:MAG: polysaccharide deacetylase family protein [Hyphomicrobium sp.]|nr:MAG: polysaccharide deacetylase family protein [Hyphomicrobium sp.]
MRHARVAVVQRTVVRMRRVEALVVGCVCLLLCGGPTAHGAPPVEACATSADKLGLSRIVEVDTAGGPLFGRVASGGYDFLADGEVVLTFDDGPLRPYTRAVLKALAQHCTKATFFMVGRMAVADPAMVREVASQGHTVASHTWSHAKLQGLAADKAKDEIELGFSAVAQALGAPMAPFFRFPYLRPSPASVDYLKTRNVASFTIDVDSRDFRTRDAAAVEKTVLTQLAGRRKGIILFHDIQPSTAHALPSILEELKKRGLKVVHIVPKETAATLAEYDAQAAKIIAQKMAAKDPLASRALTWPQSSGDPERLPWAVHKAAGAPAQQQATTEATNKRATVPWYKQWLVP